VYVDFRETFTMQGSSRVRGNTATNGGGVYASTVFTMKGGTVSGNNAKSDGGGVYVTRTLTMQGGAVSGNTAAMNGGGVYFDSGTFTNTGGTSHGNGEANNVKNTAAQGHAVYRKTGPQWRNATVGPSMNPDAYGFWLND
jgi:predicted outer membrane repeat protein